MNLLRNAKSTILFLYLVYYGWCFIKALPVTEYFIYRCDKLNINTVNWYSSQCVLLKMKFILYAYAQNIEQKEKTSIWKFQINI